MPCTTFIRCTITLLALAMCVGCAPEVERLRQSIAHPGPVAYQRGQAIQHDPYPLDDVGPEVVGARPREYQRPLNEVERARLGAPVPPGVAVPIRNLPPGPAPIAGPAYPITTGPQPVAAPAPMATTPVQVAPVYPGTPLTPAVAPQSQPRAPY
jgi:hypothetical protein